MAALRECINARPSCHVSIEKQAPLEQSPLGVRQRHFSTAFQKVKPSVSKKVGTWPSYAISCHLKGFSGKCYYDLAMEQRCGTLHFHALTSVELKAAKYLIQKPLTCDATLFRCKFRVDVLRFSPCVIILSRNEHFCCGLKKVAKSRVRVYFEQQMFALLLVFIILTTCHATSRRAVVRCVKDL